MTMKTILPVDTGRTTSPIDMSRPSALEESLAVNTSLE